MGYVDDESSSSFSLLFSSGGAVNFLFFVSGSSVSLVFGDLVFAAAFNGGSLTGVLFGRVVV